MKVQENLFQLTIYTEGATEAIDSIYCDFQLRITSVRDSGGFPNFFVTNNGRAFAASGRLVQPGSPITFELTTLKKDKTIPGRRRDDDWPAAIWYLFAHGERIPWSGGGIYKIGSLLNGGNARDYIHQWVLKRMRGVVVGMPTEPRNGGWLRFMRSDPQSFPRTGPSRCFEFKGERRNWKANRVNNHLLGELHALKIAIHGNDSMLIHPFPTVQYGAYYPPLFGDLVYNDTGNAGDPCNGKTIRQIAHLADSALTFCANFPSSFYSQIDNSISRINQAFQGEVLTDGILITATHDVSEFSFLHLPERFVSGPPSDRRSSIVDEAPEHFELEQNYPNPFNPTTNIDFNLPERGLVTLCVYNLLGQEVARLIDSEEMEEGFHSAELDATGLPSGTYYYTLTVQGMDDPSSNYKSVRRMLLLK